MIFICPFPQFFSGELANWQCRVTQQFQQSVGVLSCEVWPWVRSTFRKRNSPDSSMGAVASFVTEVNLTVLDDGVVAEYDSPNKFFDGS